MGWWRHDHRGFGLGPLLPGRDLADLPELARLVETALRSPEAQQPWRKGAKDDELEGLDASQHGESGYVM